MPDFILARFQRATDELAITAKIDRIVRITPELLERVDPTSPAGRRALRGIPVAGGASGTSPGTDPVHALLMDRKDRLR